jgi:hypothetical protein
MPSPSERMSILDRLERGEISPEEAAKLLSADEATPTKANDSAETSMDVLGKLERGEINAEEAAQRLQNGSQQEAKASQAESDFEKPERETFEVREDRFDPSRTWGWWFVPIALGALLTFLAGLWMSADVRDGGFGLGFFCAWFPLGIGILLMALGVAARRGPWANLWINKRRRGSQTDLVLNVPVPVGMAGTILRTAGRHIPGLDEQDADRLINALQESQRKGEIIQIHTHEDNDDEDIVDITIG